MAAMEPIYNISSEEMGRIRAEEQFRADIRHEIATRNTPAKESEAITLWKFLNSSFGLWLVSAIFISGLGTLYTNHQNYEKERQKVEEENRVQHKKTLDQIDRLSMEFSYRLSSALIRLKAAAKATDEIPDSEFNKLRSNALMPLSHAATDDSPPLFSEYRNYSGLALVAELRTIVEDGEKETLKSRIAALSALIGNADGSTYKDSPHAFNEIAIDLLEKIRHHRWQNGFYFTDCSKKDPFC